MEIQIRRVQTALIPKGSVRVIHAKILDLMPFLPQTASHFDDIGFGSALGQ